MILCSSCAAPFYLIIPFLTKSATIRARLFVVRMFLPRLCVLSPFIVQASSDLAKHRAWFIFPFSAFSLVALNNSLPFLLAVHVLGSVLGLIFPVILYPL